jgi:hypothetical protein
MGKKKKLVEYRTDREYDFNDQNESRADEGEHALSVATDRNAEMDPADAFTDVSDLVGNLMAFCDRAGIDWQQVREHGEHAYQGDGEDGPRAQRDPARFPAAPTTSAPGVREGGRLTGLQD